MCGSQDLKIRRSLFAFSPSTGTLEELVTRVNFCLSGLSSCFFLLRAPTPHLPWSTAHSKASPCLLDAHLSRR